MIDEELKIKPPSDELMQLIINARTELTDALKCSPDKDELAELYCQQGELGELILIHWQASGSVIGTRNFYEMAIRASKKGSKVKLAHYENKLAEFLIKWKRYL